MERCAWVAQLRGRGAPKVFAAFREGFASILAGGARAPCALRAAFARACPRERLAGLPTRRRAFSDAEVKNSSNQKQLEN